MTSRTRAGVALLALLATLSDRQEIRAEDEQRLPSDSAYNLDVQLEDQTGAMVTLAKYRGSPVIVTMLYTTCPHVCPLIVSTVKLTERELDEEERRQLRVLTISVDPERDTPLALKEYLERHRVDANRWSMTRPDAQDLRAIAGILGIKYKRLPDGEFNHSTKLTLLDENGIVVAGTSRLGNVDPEFLASVRSVLGEARETGLQRR